MKKATILFGVFAIFTVLMGLLSSCGAASTQIEGSESTATQVSYNYALTYHYCIKGDVYVSQETRQLFDSFGESAYIIPAESRTETYTEIPKAENNAKGYDPYYYVMPELNLDIYGNTHSWKDHELGMTIYANYRMVGGRISGAATDELLKVYVDSQGNIVQYDTVNFGKYDALNLDESKFEGLCSMFDSAIYKAIGTKQFYQFAAVASSPTNFRVFTDTDGRVVITTTISLERDGRIIEADLYAVVK